MSKVVLNQLFEELVEEPTSYISSRVLEKVLTPDKTSGLPRKYRLTRDWMAIKMDAPKTEIGSIALPEVSVERPFTGTVVGRGEKAITVPVGAKVWFGKFAGSMYDLDEPDILEKELLILREEDIILWKTEM